MSHMKYPEFYSRSNYTDKKQKLRIIYSQIAQCTGKQTVKQRATKPPCSCALQCSISASRAPGSVQQHSCALCSSTTPTVIEDVPETA